MIEKAEPTFFVGFFCLEFENVMDNGALSSIKEHDQDITSVKNTLLEIQSTLKHVENNQRTISKLYEAKVEHTVEIKHLSNSMERVCDELKKIDGRLGKVETLLEIERQETAARAGLRSGNFIVEAFKDYWQVIAVVATILSTFLSYFFGIRIKD